MSPTDQNHCRSAERESHDCYVAPIDKRVDSGRSAERAEAHLTLYGLGCPNCATRVRNALLAVDGVLAADVSLEPQWALVTYDPTRALPEHLAEAVFWAGATSRHAYRAEISRVQGLPSH